MPDALLLGIDIGTYSSKGVLCRANGEVLAEQQVEHGLSLPRPGWAEHDADAIWWADCQALCRALPRAAGRSADDIAAIAVSGLGPDLLPLDQHGRPLRAAILYGIDTRSTAEIEELNATFGAERALPTGTQQAKPTATGWFQREFPGVPREPWRCSSGNSPLEPVRKLKACRSVARSAEPRGGGMRAVSHHI